MMSGKKGSNSSLNVLEERVIGNLMDCGKASIEFKGHGHRRAHSYGSQGMGLAEMSKVDSYPPKFGSGGSTGANYSSPSTPPKPTSSQLSIDSYPPPSLIVDSPPSQGISPRLSPSPQHYNTPATRPHHPPLSSSVSTSIIPDSYATPPLGRRSSEDAAATARPSQSRRPFAPLKPLGLSSEKGPCPSPNDKKGKLCFKMPLAQPVKVDDKSEKQEQTLQKMVGKMSDLSLPGISSKEQQIGKGVSGHVYKLQDASGKWMAAKCMLWTDSAGERERVIRDLDVMVKHRSPHIVQYYGSKIIEKEVWVYMELMDTCLGKLLTRMKPAPFPEEVIGKVVVAVVKALDYLKTEFAVIHRDVKPSNILMDRAGHVKLCDFGISGRLVDSKAHTRDAGCVGYMAPERIQIANISKGYDVRADVWSLGISLVELSTAKFPYSKFKVDFEVLTSIVNDEPPIPKNANLSSELVNFISLCLTKDHEKRPSFKKLLDTEFVRHYDQLPVDIAAWYRRVTSSKSIT